MSVHGLIAWGSRQWKGPLYPNELAPEWAKTAGKRMKDMGIPMARINEVLQEMRNAKVLQTVFIDGIEYGIILE